MALKKYKNLFANSTQASKKKVKSTTSKQEVEQLAKIINAKIKSPEMAKKAAEILKNWGLRD